MTARAALRLPCARGRSSPGAPSRCPRAARPSGRRAARRSAPRAPRRGFTLLEVMVALGILAASLVVISDVAGGALRNHVRAQQLQIATSLARAKMVEVQAQYERKGFRDFDEDEDGSFEQEGHPEVRWKVTTLRPTVDVGPDAILQALSGGKTLQDLLPPPDQAPQLGMSMQLIQGTLTNLLTTIGEQVKKSVREVRLTVSWPSGAGTESFDVVTHLVVIEAEEK